MLAGLRIDGEAACVTTVRIWNKSTPARCTVLPKAPPYCPINAITPPPSQNSNYLSGLCLLRFARQLQRARLSRVALGEGVIDQ